MISSITKLVYELPLELPKDLRLRILGNKEILENLKFWLRHSPAPSLPRKSRYQTSLALSSFTGSLYPAANTPPRTAGPHQQPPTNLLGQVQTAVTYLVHNNALLHQELLLGRTTIIRLDNKKKYLKKQI